MPIKSSSSRTRSPASVVIGYPDYLRSDSGPEFVARGVADRCRVQVSRGFGNQPSTRMTVGSAIGLLSLALLLTPVSSDQVEECGAVHLTDGVHLLVA